MLVLGGGHGHASLSGLINHPRSWQSWPHKGPKAWLFYCLKHEFWAVLSHLPWSLMIRVNSWQHAWMVETEERRQEGKKSYQAVVHCLSLKCNIIYSGICKSNNHSALFTEGTCWFRVWEGEGERETIPNIDSSIQCIHKDSRQQLNPGVFFRFSKWRVSDNFLVVTQLRNNLNLFCRGST